MTPEQIIEGYRTHCSTYRHNANGLSAKNSRALCDAYEALKAENESLRAKVEALGKDAARYQWLRDNDLNYANFGAYVVRSSEDGARLCEEWLDRHIDGEMSAASAMQKEQV